MAGDLVSWLEAFNRKERYFLVKQALDTFSLSERFRASLSRTINLEVPENTRTWMDYHLDWVYASLQLAGEDVSEDQVFESPNFALASGTGDLELPSVTVNQNQEDADLLVAFKIDGRTHLVFIEAKGETSWGTKQFLSKVNRLNLIFDPSTKWHDANVTAHLVLMSPRRPTKLPLPVAPQLDLDSDGRPRWMPLEIADGRRKIERWDPSAGRPDHGSKYWRVRPAAASEEIVT